MDSENRKLLALVALAGVVLVGLNVPPKTWKTALKWLKGGQWILPTIAVGVLVLAVLIFLALRKRARSKKSQTEIDQAVASGPTILLLPRADWKAVDPSKVDLWGRLADALPHDEQISFEVFGSETEIAFALHGSENGVRAALTQFKAEWPGLSRRHPESDSAQLPEGWVIWWCECKPASWDRPIEPLSADPLRGALVELNGVVGQGRGMLQVIARNDFGTRRAVGQRAVAARGESGQIPHAGVRALRQKEARVLEKRFDHSFLQATIRTVGMADTPERAAGIARALARAITVAFGPSNPVQRVKEGQDPKPVLARSLGVTQAWGDNELAYLGHLVGQDMQAVAPRLKSASAKALPVAPEMRLHPLDQIARFVETS